MVRLARGIFVCSQLFQWWEDCTPKVPSLCQTLVGYLYEQHVEDVSKMYGT